MTTKTLPRLPKDLTQGGASVAVRLPFGEGSVAHRPTTDDRLNGVFVFGIEQRSAVPVAACAPDDDECRLLSAGWADHMGAQACTEDACFPDAEPR
ncbi:hypothetical protein [Micromonospora sp. HUAS LYJ1]|uniref:hypothetical protein n=1 Tax=Micromonospora sp. HUAS LYJ1 TaxID=3061626 RepID=UPI0026722A86|nr:hypothetical protein [Micromonospora sp. HUAS LYJ1]WKU03730.1 hypothetical protein Q2K16_23240 [Micromonospora sp. HUAS LYJ1]